LTPGPEIHQILEKLVAGKGLIRLTAKEYSKKMEHWRMDRNLAPGTGFSIALLFHCSIAPNFCGAKI
jgi:hypothetical protein